MQGSKWSKSKLTFRIAKYPKYSSLNHADIDRELNKAFNVWSQVSNIEFEQIKEPTVAEKLIEKYHRKHLNKKFSKRSLKPDIDVRFETGYHGDAEPFDGSGLILGKIFNYI